MAEEKHNWISDLEEGQPVQVLYGHGERSVARVSRITMSKVYLDEGSCFHKDQPPGIFPRFEPFTFVVGDPVRMERKRKVLCQRLKRFDWGILDRNQALRIYRYVKEIKKEHEDGKS